MSHYVVVFFWHTKEGADTEIIGVYHTLDDAKEIFKKYVEAEIPYAKEDEYEIYQHTDVIFEAGNEEGYEKFYIQGVM